VYDEAVRLAALLSLLGACGGIAVIDGEPHGDGGTAPGGAGHGGTPVTTTVGGSVGGEGQGGEECDTTLCDAACDAIAPCTLDGGNACKGGCADCNPNCSHALDPFWSCVADHVATDTCDYPAACTSAPIDSYLACEAWCPGTSTCTWGPGQCDCSTDFDCGPVKTYALTCVPDPMDGGFTYCDCLADGIYVGTCHDNWDVSGCDVVTGCCALLFWVPGGKPY
jgi:hypothetical protein